MNKVTLLGRFTRDPELRSFPNGGAVCNIGFVVDGSAVKDQQTGQWTTKPCFLDCKIFDGRDGKSQRATMISQSCHKGQRLLIHGHLEMETWQDKNGGGNRSKLVVMIEDFCFIEPKSDGGGQQQPRDNYGCGQVYHDNPTQAGQGGAGHDYQQPQGGEYTPEDQIPF
jgi:single-strand DNA-binding protein